FQSLQSAILQVFQPVASNLSSDQISPTPFSVPKSSLILSGEQSIIEQVFHHPLFSPLYLILHLSSGGSCCCCSHGLRVGILLPRSASTRHHQFKYQNSDHHRPPTSTQ